MPGNPSRFGSEEDRKKLLAEYFRSGLSQRKFAVKIGCHSRLLAVWIQKFGTEVRDQIDREKKEDAVRVKSQPPIELRVRVLEDNLQKLNASFKTIQDQVEEVLERVTRPHAVPISKPISEKAAQLKALMEAMQLMKEME